MRPLPGSRVLPAIGRWPGVALPASASAVEVLPCRWLCADAATHGSEPVMLLSHRTRFLGDGRVEQADKRGCILANMRNRARRQLHCVLSCSRDMRGACVHSQLDSAATGQRSVVEAISQRQTWARQELFDMRCCRMLNPRKSMPHPASATDQLNSTPASSRATSTSPPARSTAQHSKSKHHTAQRNRTPAARHSPAVRAGRYRMSPLSRPFHWQRLLGGSCARGWVLDSAPSLRVVPQQGRRHPCRLLVPAISGCCSLPLRLRRPRGGMCARNRPGVMPTAQCRLLPR